MVTVMIFYVLVNVAYYTVMTPAELLLSDAVAVVGAALLFDGYSMKHVRHTRVLI